ELTVLGMAGVAIVAVLSTVRTRFIDPDETVTRDPEIALRKRGTSAHRAITSAWGNAAALQVMVRVTAPILVVLSTMLFLRGHNAPGGGFIAALVGSAIVALLYLSTSRDKQVGPPRLPLLLIGGGVAVAVGAGLLGFLGDGFLTPLHGYLLGVHLTTSLIFDLGVYLAVLGLVMTAVNLLGTAEDTRSVPGGE